MAKSADSKRRPRIRKSAPTVRELAEAAREKSESQGKGRVRRVVSTPSAAIKNRNLGQKKPIRAIFAPFRLLGKGLSKIIPRYFVNSFRELRLVYWPSRRETWRLTLAVFIFAIVFGALVAGVDKGLDELFKKVVLK